MSLSPRAKAWLATLYRETPMPTADVERLIVAAGHTPHAVWLDFHETYAGYIEEVGPGDIAIWGLARSASAEPAPIWNAPDSVFIRPAEDRFPATICCADAHPVHGYELAADGVFLGLGGPADTFEMALERHGVMKEFYDRGKPRQTLLTKKSDEPEHQRLLAEMAQSLVPEASNASQEFYLEPKRLLRFAPSIKQLVMLELD